MQTRSVVVLSLLVSSAALVLGPGDARADCFIPYQCYCPERLVGTIDGEVVRVDAQNNTVEFSITSVTANPDMTSTLPLPGESIMVSGGGGVTSGRALLFLREEARGNFVESVLPVSDSGEVSCTDSADVARDAEDVASASVKSYRDCVLDLDLEPAQCGSDTLCSTSGSTGSPWGLSVLLALGFIGFRSRRKSARR